MKFPKFYIGPMTDNVINSVLEYSNETNISIGFIPSRRQIDFDGGYTGWNTRSFMNYVGTYSNIIIERDHSGLKQGKHFKNPSYDYLSIVDDVQNNLDVIHLDPWKKYKNYNNGLRETINNIVLINKLNPDILFEIGTEESIRPFSPDELNKLLSDLKKELGKLFNNIIYAVIQSGTKLFETKNIGVFNLEKLNAMISVCKNYNILSKEHNGDYLSNEQIKIRFNSGLDAINIAPEFGVLETNIILDNINNEDTLNKIFEICLTGKKWNKWVGPEFKPNKNKLELIKICGHYHNKELKQISKIDDSVIKQKIKQKLQELNSI